MPNWEFSDLDCRFKQGSFTVICSIKLGLLSTTAITAGANMEMKETPPFHVAVVYLKIMLNQIKSKMILIDWVED